MICVGRAVNFIARKFFNGNSSSSKSGTPCQLPWIPTAILPGYPEDQLARCKFDVGMADSYSYRACPVQTFGHSGTHSAHVTLLLRSTLGDVCTHAVQAVRHLVRWDPEDPREIAGGIHSNGNDL